MSDQQQSIRHRPESERDRAIRYTFLRPFDDPESVAALEEIAQVVLLFAREANEWGARDDWHPGPDELLAAAEDLEAVATCLEESATEIDGYAYQPRDKTFGRDVDRWSRQVRIVANRIRRGVAEAYGDGE